MQNVPICIDDAIRRCFLANKFALVLRFLLTLVWSEIK